MAGGLFLLFVVIFGCVILACVTPNEEELRKETEGNISKFVDMKFNGEEKHVKSLNVNYLGGLKGLSANNKDYLFINLFESGIAIFDSTHKNIIKYGDIKDLYISNERSIRENVSLGKLFCFGILAFGMKGNVKEENRELIVVKVNDSCGEYNVVFDPLSNAQKVYDSINEMLTLYKEKK